MTASLHSSDGPPLGVPVSALQPVDPPADNHHDDEDIWPQPSTTSNSTHHPRRRRDLLTMEVPVEGEAEPRTILLFRSPPRSRRAEGHRRQQRFEGPNPLAWSRPITSSRAARETKIYTALRV